MTPTFNPDPIPLARRRSTSARWAPADQATAEVADGLLVMPFGSAKFLARATMPAVRDGLAASGGPVRFAIVPEIILSAGEDHDATRRLLAFYGSTPGLPPGARHPTAGAICSPS